MLANDVQISQEELANYLRSHGLEQWKLELAFAVKNDKKEVLMKIDNEFCVYGTLNDALDAAKTIHEKMFNFPEKCCVSGATLISYLPKQLTWLEHLRLHIKLMPFRYTYGWKGVCFVTYNTMENPKTNFIQVAP